MDLHEEAQKLFEQLGTVRSQPSGDWTGSFALPQELAEFYERVGPVDIHVPALGNDIFFPSLANLWKHQRGYRFKENPGDLIDGWNDDWLVLADQGADPFIYSRQRGEILEAQHGQGSWEPEDHMPGLLMFAGCVASMGVVAKGAGPELLDRSEEFVQERHAEAAIQRLLVFLEQDEQAARLLLMLSGWIPVDEAIFDEDPDED